jgi:hypothetical protein
VDALDRFLHDLASARIGTTFNPYRDADPAFDRPWGGADPPSTRIGMLTPPSTALGAAQIRLGNLAAYLRAWRIRR